MHYRQAKKWQIILYPMANGAQNMFLVLMMFASYLAAGSYGIAVALAGTIITLTRVLDGVTDPILGLFSEKLSTKFGKVRILLMLGWAIMAFATTALFYWGVGQGLKFFTGFYVIYIIGYTLVGIAQQLGNAILTNDPRDRPKIFRWATIYTTLLATFTSVYMSKFLFPKYGGLSIGAFREMCLSVVGATFVILVLSSIAISEKDKPESFVSIKKQRIKLKDALSLLKSNHALQAFIIAASSDKLALQTASQSAINTLIFGVLIGNYSFYGTLGMINLIPTLLFVFLATRFAGRSGSKKAVIQWTIVSIIIGVSLVAFMYFVDPRQISQSILPTAIFIILNAAFSATKMATSATTMAMIPDIADYENYRSGNYMPAVVGTVYSFVDKLISSLAATIVGFSLAAIGYATKMPQPNDPITPSIFWMSMFLWMGVPLIGWLLTLIAMKFYPLDKEMMVTVQETIEVKKAEISI